MLVAAALCHWNEKCRFIKPIKALFIPSATKCSLGTTWVQFFYCWGSIPKIWESKNVQKSAQFQTTSDSKYAFAQHNFTARRMSAPLIFPQSDWECRAALRWALIKFLVIVLHCFVLFSVEMNLCECFQIFVLFRIGICICVNVQWGGVCLAWMFGLSSGHVPSTSGQLGHHSSRQEAGPAQWTPVQEDPLLSTASHETVLQAPTTRRMDAYRRSYGLPVCIHHGHRIKCFCPCNMILRCNKPVLFRFSEFYACS